MAGDLWDLEVGGYLDVVMVVHGGHLKFQKGS